ncbi:TPA: polyribonucleotide nucleotidyltransferase, partial [Streptococcus pneumoniae]|nr:polyribonucleotide nucleotidyltransferase [Streptococcus pneumoniae]
MSSSKTSSVSYFYFAFDVLGILIFVGKAYNFINPKGIKMAKQVFQTTFAGRELIVETGQLAKQANGSVVVRYGESTVLTAAVMSKKMATGDFFPLQVNYEEKMYAAGK